MTITNGYPIPDTNMVLGIDTDNEQIVLTIHDEVDSRWPIFDTHIPPVCAICVEDGNDVEPDGRCEHGKPSFLIKMGMI